MSLIKVIDGATEGNLGGNAIRNRKIAGAYGPC